jgi:hypothetical protein
MRPEPVQAMCVVAFALLLVVAAWFGGPSEPPGAPA